MNRGEFQQRWSELHGGAPITGATKGWLYISFAIARVLAFFRISPFVITTLGLVVSLLMFATEYVDILIALLVIALICDGVDGSLAIYRGKASRLGELYDSVTDRITEAIWLYMCAFVGLSVKYIIAIWVLASVQEYMRTKLASSGYREVGVITPTERPMRAIFVAAIFLSYRFGFDITHDIAYGFIALQLLSGAMIAKMSRSILVP